MGGPPYEDTTQERRNEGRVPRSGVLMATSAFPRPASLISCPHAQKQLFSLSTEGLKSQ